MPEKKIKAVILIGGPAKGTRFRPLSLEVPKPFFPIAGYPIISHHIESFCKIDGMKEIIIIGFYQPNSHLKKILNNEQKSNNIPIRYLQEFASLGTAGGLYQFRDQIMLGSPDYIFVMNCDVCGDIPFQEMLDFTLKKSGDCFLIMGTIASNEQSKQFGCIVENPKTQEVLHFVEKPSTFVSNIINCGIYLFTPGIFKFLRAAFLSRQEVLDHEKVKESINLEKEVFQPMAGGNILFVYKTNRFWSQIKNTSSVIYANRHYLCLYQERFPERLAKMNFGSLMELNKAEKIEQEGPTIIGLVFIHPNTSIDKSAVIGPNVSIAENVKIGPGVRLRDCIVLQDAQIASHACCINSVIGWSAKIGEWSRVEGTPNDPNPNAPFKMLEILPVFNKNGQLNPSITVIGKIK